MKYKVLYDKYEVYQIGDIIDAEDFITDYFLLTNLDNNENVNWLENIPTQDAINIICDMLSMELEKIN